MFKNKFLKKFKIKCFFYYIIGKHILINYYYNIINFFYNNNTINEISDNN